MTKEQIFAFIDEQKTALISSIDAQGYPNTKAMYAPRKREENRLYFTTNLSALRTAQYAANEKACVYFYKRGRFGYTGVMLLGTMQVQTQQSIKDEIWREGDTLFYAGGPADPDYCVLCFTAQKCRVYQNRKTVSLEL